MTLARVSSARAGTARWIVAWLVTLLLSLSASVHAQNGTNLTQPIDAAEAQGEPLLVVGLLVVATISLVLGIWLVRHAHRKTRTRFEALAFKHLREFKIGSVRVRSADWTRTALVRIADGIRAVLVLTLFVLYIPFVASLFEPTQGLYRRSLAIARDQLSSFGTAIGGYLPNLIFILLVATITAVALKLLKALAEQIYEGHISVRGFYPSWARPTYTLARVVVLAFILVLILPRLPGFGSDAFQGISLFVGALVALGASSAMANVISGAVLTYTRAFSVGDRVQIADTTGDVVERSLLVTRIRTIKNEDITVPNAQVLSSHIVNYSGMSEDRPLIVHTSVSIGYEVPWREANELLLRAAEATEGVLREPEPFVLQTELGDFAVTYEVNVYTDRPVGMARLRSALHRSIRDTFEAEGVEILSPRHTALRESTPVEQRRPPTRSQQADDGMAADAGDLSEAERTRVEQAEREAAADEAAEAEWTDEEAEGTGGSDRSTQG